MDGVLLDTGFTILAAGILLVIMLSLDCIYRTRQKRQKGRKSSKYVPGS